MRNWQGAPKGNASPLLKAICGQSFICILSGIVVIWAVMAAVTIVLLRNTPYGRKIYSVGTNEQAARFSGIHTGRVNMVNAGIKNVGLLTRRNYDSLLSHVSSGKDWGLNKKRG